MEKTIAAISTAMSASGIGIVRISGDEAMDVISRIYRSKNGKKNIREVQSHTIHYGFIYDGEDVVDEVLVMIMRGPHTYTGEDTVEIDCHGGVYAMKKVLETVLKNGAVIAEPGEFTKRAFLNGRLDLSQAEAVMDVIQAKNSMALKSSVEQLKGSVQRAVKEIRSRLLYQIAYIESALDDPEHYDLTGKTIHPFCTHEGSGLGHTPEHIASLAPGASITSGFDVKGSQVDERASDIADWAMRDRQQ